MTNKSPLAVYLDEIKDPGKPVSMARLTNLSDLSPVETSLFGEAWSSIGTQRRLEILGKLLELAEENLELNFDNVFSSCVAGPGQ